jgi:hypothetical protein
MFASRASIAAWHCVEGLSWRRGPVVASRVLQSRGGATWHRPADFQARAVVTLRTAVAICGLSIGGRGAPRERVRLPALYQWPELAELDGLAGYGPGLDFSPAPTNCSNERFCGLGWMPKGPQIHDQRASARSLLAAEREGIEFVFCRLPTPSGRSLSPSRPSRRR